MVECRIGYTLFCFRDRSHMSPHMLGHFFLFYTWTYVNMPHTSLVNLWSKTPRGYHVLCTTPLETRYTISRKMITPLFRISQQRFASSLGIGCVLFQAMCVLWISFRYLSFSISYSIYLHPKDGPPLFIFYLFFPCMWWMHFCYFLLSLLTIMVVVDWCHDYRMMSRTCLGLAQTF